MVICENRKPIPQSASIHLSVPQLCHQSPTRAACSQGLRGASSEIEAIGGPNDAVGSCGAFVFELADGMVMQAEPEMQLKPSLPIAVLHDQPRSRRDLRPELMELMLCRCWMIQILDDRIASSTRRQSRYDPHCRFDQGLQ